MKCTVLSLAALLAVSASAETLNLNADWRFAWANETIPLKNAMASMAKDGIDIKTDAKTKRVEITVKGKHP